MRAGTLKNRVTIQQLIGGQDSIGQPTNTWVDWITVWASVMHKSGFESIKADADTSVVPASIRIRRRSGINAGMRLILVDTVYQIKAVVPDEQDHKYVDLVCERING